MSLFSPVSPSYCYGFALSLVISNLAGMVLLDRDPGILEYDTFMLR